MKKLFAIVLAVVMVLGVASSALAFSWAKPTESADKFGYSIDAIKYSRSTAALGSSSFNVDENAAAVNGADVYWAVKLVVPDLKATNGTRVNAKAKVVLTALDDAVAETVIDIPLAQYPAGTYYFYSKGSTELPVKGMAPGTYYFYPVTFFVSNNLTMNRTAETPVYGSACLDTDTAKVYAKVYSERDFAKGWFTVGSYDVKVETNSITFKESAVATPGSAVETVATFWRDGNDKVVKVDTCANGQKVAALYRWLNDGSADAIYTAIDKGEMYMSDDNLRVAFGFTYKVEDQITWKANSNPIILDPTVGIPKTGDNASVIGFAMIMVAVVAAAVAVKKVNA